MVTMAMLTISCSRHRPVDYEAYERIPISPVSTTFRALAKCNPLISKKAFYGCYGGPGNSGGEPEDEMDELFRRHDIVYQLARTKEMLVAADKELVKGLQELDTRKLDPEAEEYRQRAIKFFSSPVSELIGKPLSALYTRHEREGCYFHHREVVREFFSEEHSGMPRFGRRKAAGGRR